MHKLWVARLCRLDLACRLVVHRPHDRPHAVEVFHLDALSHRGDVAREAALDAVDEPLLEDAESDVFTVNDYARQELLR